MGRCGRRWAGAGTGRSGARTVGRFAVARLVVLVDRCHPPSEVRRGCCRATKGVPRVRCRFPPGLPVCLGLPRCGGAPRGGGSGGSPNDATAGLTLRWLTATRPRRPGARYRVEGRHGWWPRRGRRHHVGCSRVLRLTDSCLARSSIPLRPIETAASSLSDAVVSLAHCG